MGNIKIITDSTCYISKKEAEERNITVVPLKYIFDDIIYEEGYSGEFDEYFLKLENSKLFPTTSQPSTGDLYSAFEEAVKEYDHVIGIFLSSELSGTYNNALLVKEMLDSDKITVIDSYSSVAAMRFMITNISDMIGEGKTIKEIVDSTEELKSRMEVFLTTETLEYLYRGGRLSKFESKVGDVLKIKPIIELTEGKLIQVDKVRGKKKSIKNMINRVHDNVERIAICHILNHLEAEKFKEELEKEYPEAVVSIEEIGPVIGSHLGPKTIGICYY